MNALFKGQIYDLIVVSLAVSRKVTLFIYHFNHLSIWRLGHCTVSLVLHPPCPIQHPQPQRHGNRNSRSISKSLLATEAQAPSSCSQQSLKTAFPVFEPAFFAVSGPRCRRTNITNSPRTLPSTNPTVPLSPQTPA